MFLGDQGRDSLNDLRQAVWVREEGWTSEFEVL